MKPGEVCSTSSLSEHDEATLTVRIHAGYDVDIVLVEEADSIFVAGGVVGKQAVREVFGNLQ